MRYQNGLNRVLLLRANDLGFHATTTSAVSRRSARAQLTAIIANGGGLPVHPEQRT